MNPAMVEMLKASIAMGGEEGGGAGADAGTPGVGGAAQEYSGNGFGHNGVPDFMKVSKRDVLLLTFYCLRTVC